MATLVFPASPTVLAPVCCILIFLSSWLEDSGSFQDFAVHISYKLKVLSCSHTQEELDLDRVPGQLPKSSWS